MSKINVCCKKIKVFIKEEIIWECVNSNPKYPVEFCIDSVCGHYIISFCPFCGKKLEVDK